VARRYGDDFAEGLDAGVGRPVPAASVRIVDPATGHSHDEPETMGEIAVACPWQMAYYTGDRTHTDQVRAPDGALLSGDFGRFDSRGYLHLIGRRKEMIITGGENVFPIEVEDVYGRYPGVGALAVYGVGDPVWGERVELALVMDGCPAPAIADIRSFGRTRLASYKIPRSLVVLPALPLTPNLKVDKRALAASTEVVRDTWEH
jgi:acyl-CoA synthetase (AMP-forming)/AMP-acid ligase II